jgi:hypothetical protein
MYVGTNNDILVIAILAVVVGLIVGVNLLLVELFTLCRPFISSP